jgi:hypothetical protein
MFKVTLKSSARKSDYIGLFASETVATYVAQGLEGFDSGEGPAAGVVTSVEVNLATSVQEYEDARAAAVEFTKREEWAAFYEGMSAEQKTLMSQFGPASITAGV